jgi:hypothetical protein
MKIALCFSGQSRAFEKGYEYYKRNLLDHYDVDVYFHTWHAEDNQQYIDLYKPVKYILEKPVNPDLSKYTRTPIPLKHPQINTYSLYYSMYECSKLIEGEYDWVVRSRSDYALNIKPDLENSDNSKLHIPNCYIAPLRDRGNDQFAFASQEIMNKYMSAFLNIDKYYDNGTIFNGECIMQANLHEHNLHGDNLVYVDMKNPFPAGRYNGGTHSLIRDDFSRWNPGVTVW